MHRYGRFSRYTRAVALAAVLGVLLVTGATACGVSASRSPVDHGGGLKADTSGNDAVRSVPQPNEARSADALVRLFLKAPVGGSESAIGQVKTFLTPKALAEWKEPANPQSPQLNVIRIVRGPTPGVATGERTPVTVDYQLVGLLNEQGRVEDLSDLVTRQMTFWVTVLEEDRSNLRIDEIVDAPPGLLLSDEALTDIYRIQPIYFWDAANSLLVPDLRYLPLTLTEEPRANRVLQWLLDGPSGWLGTQRLPTGTRKEPPVVKEGRLVVNLSGEAAAGGAESLTRLYFQLQWSLSTVSSREIDLQIDGKSAEIGISPDAFRPYNLSSTFTSSRQKYDIVDERVVQVDGGPTPQGPLASAENATVVYAAMNRDASIAGLVRRRPSDNRRYLQIVRGGVPVVNVSLTNSEMSRPSWIPVPGAKDELLLVAAGGRLYSVRPDGAFGDVTPSRLTGVTDVVVAPDGRRVALIAAGRAYVASLSVLDRVSVTIGPNPRPILGGHVTATGVGWSNEQWLYVGGTAQGAPAMWRASADGVVARDESANLKGLAVSDLVTLPTWPATRLADVIVYANGGVYNFGTTTAESGLRAPFFGS